MSDRDQAAVRREIAARRRGQAYQMRREGASLETIGTRLGITRQAAHKMVARETRQLAAEADPEERRLLHADALMDLWRAFYGPASEGDPEAADRFLRVEERLAHLLGLDRQAPAAAAAAGDDDGDRPARPTRVRRFVPSDDGQDVVAEAQDLE